MDKNNGKDEKKSRGEFEDTAQGLLRRLNSQFDTERAQSEKKSVESVEKLDDDDFDIILGDGTDAAEKATDADVTDAGTAADSDKKKTDRDEENEILRQLMSEFEDAPVKKKDDPLDVVIVGAGKDIKLMTETEAGLKVGDEAPAEDIPAEAAEPETVSAEKADDGNAEADTYAKPAEPEVPEAEAENVKPVPEKKSARKPEFETTGSVYEQIALDDTSSDASVAKEDADKKTEEAYIPVAAEENDEADEELIEMLKDTSEIGEYKPTSQGSASKENTVVPANKEEKKFIMSETETQELPDITDAATDTDTSIMAAFGHATEKQTEKNAKKIFNEYSFSDTDELYKTPDEEKAEKERIESVKTTVGETKRQSFRRNNFEFSEFSQNREIISAYRAKYTSVRIRLIVCAIVGIILGLFENIPVFGALFEQSYYFALVDLILVGICAILVSGRMSYVFKALSKFTFDVDSLTFVYMLYSIATTCVMLVMSINDPYTSFNDPSTTLKLFNFPFAFCVFMNIVCEFFNVRRDIYSFKIVSSGNEKRILSCISRTERASEEMEFSDYMGDGSEVYKAKTASFISDFFARKAEFPRAKRCLNIFIPFTILASVAFFAIATFVSNFEISQSIMIGYFAFTMCAPISMMISYAYPAYISSIKAYSYGAAIIGDTASEEYERASVIVFKDTDAFPTEKVKIKSVKVFANNRIDDVIYYASSVYSKIGGPLAAVFQQATLNSMNSSSVEIKELDDNGIDAFVDGVRIVMGQPGYMENQCFETVFEPGDEAFEGKSNKRILYLACNDTVIAKFYVQYSTTTDFLYIVRNLYKQGICVSIHTCDPCLSNEVLYKNKLDPTEFPVRIVKGKFNEKDEKIVSANSGSIVSSGSVKGLIKTLVICDKLNNTGKSNLAVKIVTSIIGLALTAVMLVAGATGNMMSFIPVVYQAFWMIPIYLVSKIYV